MRDVAIEIKALKPLSSLSFFSHDQFFTFYFQALEEGAVANLIAMSLEVQYLCFELYLAKNYNLFKQFGWDIEGYILMIYCSPLWVIL